MKAVWKGGGLFVAVTCMVWIAVLWRWRTSSREPDGGDVVVYFGVLPVLVFLLALSGRWAVRSALSTQDAANAAAAARQAGAGGSADPRPASPPPLLASGSATWHLRGAGVRTVAGASVEALLQAIEAGAPRPRPDPALRDQDGFPVMTSRVHDLETEALDATWPGAAAAGDAPGPVRAVRALALLAPLLDDMMASLPIAWVPAAAATPPAATPDAGPRSAASSKPAAGGTDRRVRVFAAWPADWDDATCAAATAWLTARLCDPPLDTGLTFERASIRAERLSGGELLAAADCTLAALQAQGRDDPVVLLACHSDLDDAGIRHLETTQRLFHATRRPKAAMAGEGAAVLVVSASPARADAGSVSGVRLGSPSIARRAGSIGPPYRAGPNDATLRLRAALESAGVPAAAVAALASDADQHTARATELFAVTLALLPELDAHDDLRLAGTVTGRLGAVAPLVTLACAAAQAVASGRPAAALSLADPHWCMAAVVVPDAFSASPALAQAPATPRTNPSEPDR